jgi:DMSO/TMAO reductase YedYZ molybdopterin-dependent catalytic subunit
MDSTERAGTVRSAIPTVLVGLFAGLSAVAGSYAVAGFTPSFVVAPVAGVLSRHLPDVVIRYAITVLGSLGQQLNLLTAAALVVTGIGTVAAASRYAGRRLHNRALPVVVTTALTWGLAVSLTGQIRLSLAAALPAGAIVLLAVAVDALSARESSPGDPSAGRRSILATGASTLGVGLLGYVLGSQRTAGGGTERAPLGNTTSGDSAPSRRQELLDAAEQQSFDVDGMEPLVSENFFTVDVNAVDPTVDAEAWTLSVTGAVETEVTVDYEEVRSMPATDRFETLRCVGESLNGQKMDTALWTGVPIMDLVERAGPRSGCECVMLRAADDYYEEFPLAAMDDGLLAFGMNGTELPRAHGYPVRALVPGHWGEINVKWLTEIELLERETAGYWEERGWHGTGPVNTVAKLHAENDLADGRKEVGGHAYAGTRGIERVDVSTDGGDTWTAAELSEPLEGVDAWRQWRYAYDPPGGAHQVVVRATDGTGAVQPSEETGAFPSGPTGWVSRTVR